MAKKSGGDVRIVINLACEECKRRNYTTSKNKISLSSQTIRHLK